MPSLAAKPSRTQAPPIRQRAVQFAMGVIMRSTDWQEVQHALADHDEFGPWLEAEFGAEAIAEAQAIIHDAEQELGPTMPPDYG